MRDTGQTHAGRGKEKRREIRNQKSECSGMELKDYVDRYGFITDVCRGQKVADRVDYVLLSIKVAPGFQGHGAAFR